MHGREGRDEVVRGVVGAIVSGDGEDGGDFGRALKEIGRVVEERLGCFGWIEGSGQGGGGGEDERMQILLKECELGAASLLARWPDAWKALPRSCINVPLPGELRKVAWDACLKDKDVAEDFQKYLHSDRYASMCSKFTPSLYDLCQAYLSHTPTLHPLASRYSCVKRMEQVLMYLLEPKSCPGLREIRRAMECLGSLGGDMAVEVAFGSKGRGWVWEWRGDVLGGSDDVEDENGLEKENVQEQEEPEEVEEEEEEAWTDIMSDGGQTSTSTRASKPVSSRHRTAPSKPPLSPPSHFTYRVGSSTSRSRQLAVLVPFLKAMDLDGGTTFSKAEEEARTMKIVEAAAKFWGWILPRHWRESGEYSVRQIAVDVEAELAVANSEISRHVLRIVGEGKEKSMGKNSFLNTQNTGMPGHDFRGVEPLVRMLVGDLFVGKCSLETLTYMYDQIILCSQESTDDHSLPPVDTLIAWFCCGFIMSMRDAIMKCETLETLATLIPTLQPSIPVVLIRAHVDLRLAPRVARDAALYVPADDIDLNEVSKMKRWMKRAEVRGGGSLAELEEEEGEADTATLDETDLVEAEKENEAEKEVEKWKAVRLWYLGRGKRNIKMWQRKTRYVIYWHRFLSTIRDAVELRKEQGLRERLQRSDSTSPTPPPKPQTPNPKPSQETITSDISSIDDLDRSMVLRSMWETLAREYDNEVKNWENQAVSEKEELVEVQEPRKETPKPKSVAITEEERDEEERVEEKSNVEVVEVVKNVEEIRVRAKPPPFRTGSLMVTRGTVLGEELEHLTPIGKMMKAMIDRIQYVVESGPKLSHPYLNRQISNSIQFSSRFYTDLAEVISQPAIVKKWAGSAKLPPDVVLANNNGFWDPNKVFSTQVNELCGGIVESEREEYQGADEEAERERISERREELFAVLEKIRKGRTTGNDGDGKGENSKDEKAKEEAIDSKAVDLANAYATQVLTNSHDANRLKTMQGLISLVAERLSLIIHGEPILHETYIVTSDRDARGFADDELQSWVEVYGDAVPFTKESVRQAVDLGEEEEKGGLSRGTTVNRKASVKAGASSTLSPKQTDASATSVAPSSRNLKPRRTSAGKFKRTSRSFSMFSMSKRGKRGGSMPVEPLDETEEGEGNAGESQTIRSVGQVKRFGVHFMRKMEARRKIRYGRNVEAVAFGGAGSPVTITFDED
ncbi:hypothetical protein HDU97_004367 [Phlyctochytrium planicorne]|nr:hypothetical protein HDU97_004367 [Phlyctochytrium planicorne]